MSLYIYLFTFAINLWHRKFVTSDVTAVFVNDQHGIQRRVQYFNTRVSAIAEEPRDALRQLKYYGRFLTELLTRSSANPEEPCEHTVS